MGLMLRADGQSQGDLLLALGAAASDQFSESTTAAAAAAAAAATVAIAADGAQLFGLPEATTTTNFTSDLNSSSTQAIAVAAQSALKWPVLGLISFMFIGATGNILVCAAVMRERRLQTATNYFLLSLAVADLLVCSVVMPFGIIYEFHGRWPYDWRICNVWVTSDVLTTSSSILHMCFISVGRYLGIRNPLHARQANLFVSRRAVLWRIAIAWASSALIASPITMMSLYDHKNIVPSPNECAISNKYFMIFGSLLAFFIPMFVMVPAYVMTVRLLSRRAKFVNNDSMLLANQHLPQPAGGGADPKSSEMECNSSTAAASQRRQQTLTRAAAAAAAAAGRHNRSAHPPGHRRAAARAAGARSDAPNERIQSRLSEPANRNSWLGLIRPGGDGDQAVTRARPDDGAELSVAAIEIPSETLNACRYIDDKPENDDDDDGRRCRRRSSSHNYQAGTITGRAAANSLEASPSPSPPPPPPPPVQTRAGSPAKVIAAHNITQEPARCRLCQQARRRGRQHRCCRCFRRAHWIGCCPTPTGERRLSAGGPRGRNLSANDDRPQSGPPQRSAPDEIRAANSRVDNANVRQLAANGASHCFKLAYSSSSSSNSNNNNNNNNNNANDADLSEFKQTNTDCDANSPPSSEIGAARKQETPRLKRLNTQLGSDRTECTSSTGAHPNQSQLDRNRDHPADHDNDIDNDNESRAKLEPAANERSACKIVATGRTAFTNERPADGYETWALFGHANRLDMNHCRCHRRHRRPEEARNELQAIELHDNNRQLKERPAIVVDGDKLDPTRARGQQQQQQQREFYHMIDLGRGKPTAREVRHRIGALDSTSGDPNLLNSKWSLAAGKLDDDSRQGAQANCWFADRKNGSKINGCGSQDELLESRLQSAPSSIRGHQRVLCFTCAITSNKQAKTATTNASRESSSPTLPRPHSEADAVEDGAENGEKEEDDDDDEGRGHQLNSGSPSCRLATTTTSTTKSHRLEVQINRANSNQSSGCCGEQAKATSLSSCASLLDEANDRLDRSRLDDNSRDGHPVRTARCCCNVRDGGRPKASSSIGDLSICTTSCMTVYQIARHVGHNQSKHHYNPCHHHHHHHHHQHQHDHSQHRTRNHHHQNHHRHHHHRHHHGHDRKHNHHHHHHRHHHSSSSNNNNNNNNHRHLHQRKCSHRPGSFGHSIEFKQEDNQHKLDTFRSLNLCDIEHVDQKQSNGEISAEPILIYGPSERSRDHAQGTQTASWDISNQSDRSRKSSGSHGAGKAPNSMSTQGKVTIKLNSLERDESDDLGTSSWSGSIRGLVGDERSQAANLASGHRTGENESSGAPPTSKQPLEHNKCDQEARSKVVAANCDRSASQSSLFLEVPSGIRANNNNNSGQPMSRNRLDESARSADGDAQAAPPPPPQPPISTINSVGQSDEPQMIRYLGSSVQVRSEQKATKVLGVVFFTFVFCWTPFFVMNFLSGLVGREQVSQWVSDEMMTTFLWLGYISSTINPVIYTVFNRNFRRAFRRLLLCREPVGRRHYGQSRGSEFYKSFRFSINHQNTRQSNQIPLVGNGNSNKLTGNNNNNNRISSSSNHRRRLGMKRHRGHNCNRMLMLDENRTSSGRFAQDGEDHLMTGQNTQRAQSGFGAALKTVLRNSTNSILRSNASTSITNQDHAPDPVELDLKQKLESC